MGETRDALPEEVVAVYYLPSSKKGVSIGTEQEGGGTTVGRVFSCER